MHELSIVLGIVDLAEEQLKRNHGEKIHEIELEIGELAGVAWDALDFAWNEGVRGTALAESRRVIRKTPGKARCMDCQIDYDLERIGNPCPHCGSFLADVYQGKELRVVSMLID
jgi:hydrogenase nickel incorporation protein HypA/HybF